MIRKSRPGDFDAIYALINNAAAAYKGLIPDDRWHDPYMTRTELQGQIDRGVKSSCYCEDERVPAVMGIRVGTWKAVTWTIRNLGGCCRRKVRCGESQAPLVEIEDRILTDQRIVLAHASASPGPGSSFFLGRG